MIENYIYKFTDTNVSIEDLKESDYYKMLENCLNGDFKMLKEKSTSYWYMDLARNGYLKLQGYVFRFKPFLKKYLVQHRYENHYNIYYAYNKTCLYKLLGRYNIIDIVER